MMLNVQTGLFYNNIFSNGRIVSKWFNEITHGSLFCSDKNCCFTLLLQLFHWMFAQFLPPSSIFLMSIRPLHDNLRYSTTKLLVVDIKQLETMDGISSALIDIFLGKIHENLIVHFMYHAKSTGPALLLSIRDKTSPLHFLH